MFTTGHLFAGLAVAGALGLTGTPALLFVTASVLADWDYPIGRWLGVNHRYLITHAPAFWFPLGAVGVWWAPAGWVFLGFMLHFALDLFDLGLRLNPFSSRTVGLGLLPVADEAPFGAYVRTYFRTPFFATVEAVAFVAAAVAWLPRLSG